MSIDRYEVERAGTKACAELQALPRALRRFVRAKRKSSKNVLREREHSQEQVG
jgi:hypothetical protein